MLIFKI